MLKLPDSEALEFHTPGLNPYFLTENEITRIIANTPAIQPYASQVTEIYFFGAGCSTPDKHEIVSNGLSAFFKNAFISVDSDSIGSAYATCGTSKGFSCVLGTGSNIAFFDGKNVINGVHGLGYILGDEGSGTYYGKKLITGYMYGTMPAEIAHIFGSNYTVDHETITKNLYQQAGGNLYLASFAKFLSEVKTHSYTQNLLKTGFNEFIDTHILTYPDYTHYTFHFVGSIAYHFKDILLATCKQKSVKVGKVLQKPIHDLFDFIVKRETALNKN